MLTMKLDTLLKDTNSVESYILFREIEDWCTNNIPKDRWRFCHSPQICIHGVDLPGRIIFKSEQDLTAFKLRFNAG